jgi:hypothetical protein
LERKVQFVDNSNANASSLVGYVATQSLFARDRPNIKFFLDPDVNDKGTTGKTLTIPAMTGVNNQRIRR